MEKIFNGDGYSTIALIEKLRQDIVDNDFLNELTNDYQRYNNLKQNNKEEANILLLKFLTNLKTMHQNFELICERILYSMLENENIETLELIADILIDKEGLESLGYIELKPFFTSLLPKYYQKILELNLLNDSEYTKEVELKISSDISALFAYTSIIDTECINEFLNVFNPISKYDDCPKNYKNDTYEWANEVYNTAMTYGIDYLMVAKGAIGIENKRLALSAYKRALDAQNNSNCFSTPPLGFEIHIMKSDIFKPLKEFIFDTDYKDFVLMTTGQKSLAYNLVMHMYDEDTGVLQRVFYDINRNLFADWHIRDYFYEYNVTESIAKDFGDIKWAEKLLNNKFQKCIDFYDFVYFAEAVIKTLNDKEWAEKLYKSALSKCGDIYFQVLIAPSISKYLGDKLWAKKLIINALLTAKTSDDIKIIKSISKEAFNDIEWMDTHIGMDYDSGFLGVYWENYE